MIKLIKRILREETLFRDSKYGWIVNAIKNIFEDENEFESLVSLPYDNEDTFSVTINYSIDKVSIWENTRRGYYEGVVYPKIKSLMVGNDGVYEKGYHYNDIPEWIWDDLNDYILEKINAVIPRVFDVNTGYTIEVDFPREW